MFRTTALALYLIALTLIVPLLFALGLALQIVPVFGAAALPMATQDQTMSRCSFWV